ncbi:MAG TPA: hypothetical protein VLV47_00130 [Candidatus Bathyarchaeia archaeon]|nr:hypothetical protein [Candidatus Bathyarchaeia archaeon]
MRRIALLISIVAAFALCAGAQTVIDFHDMPFAFAPSPMPDNYPTGMGLYWDNFSYVTPGLWSGEGKGFWVDPSTRPNDVAFAGGPLCNLRVPCTAMIKMIPMVAAPANKTFTPVTITLAAGWQDNKVTVTAYNNGTYVGTLVWQLMTKPTTYTFPAAWKVTQLAFTPEYLGDNAVAPQGSVVIYKFMLMMN